MDNEIKQFRLGNPECATQLAEMLKTSKSGWLDKEIGRKAPKVTISSTFSDLNAICYDNFDVYELHVNRPYGVSVTDLFISGHLDEHMEHLNRINILLQNKRIGEILYYEFYIGENFKYKNGINGFVKIYAPVDKNSEKIKTQIQEYINEMPDDCIYPKPNGWRVQVGTCTYGKNYLDQIEQTLKKKYTYLFNMGV